LAPTGSGSNKKNQTRAAPRSAEGDGGPADPLAASQYIGQHSKVLVQAAPGAGDKKKDFF